jgi:hypothetical protein
VKFSFHKVNDDGGVLNRLEDFSGLRISKEKDWDVVHGGHLEDEVDVDVSGREGFMKEFALFAFVPQIGTNLPPILSTKAKKNLEG